MNSDRELRRLVQLTAAYPVGTEVQVSIGQLEAVFFTSRRNVSNILGQLAQLGWIEWYPNPGRGRLNRLRVIQSEATLLQASMDDALKRGQYKQLAQWIAHFGAVAVDNFQQVWLSHISRNRECSRLQITQYPWVDCLDPSLTFRRAELQVCVSLFDTLLVIEEDELRPSLAHDWEQEKAWLRFWLRPDVRFHDGSFLTADSVVYSLRRMAAGPMSAVFGQIAEVRATGDLQVEIRLASPNSLFAYALATPHASIYSERSITFGDSRVAHIGTGPFRLQQWDDERLRLARNTSYFATGALLDELVLEHAVIPDSLLDTVSFNRDIPQGTRRSLHSASYLSVKKGTRPGIDQRTMQDLLSYLEAMRGTFGELDPIENMLGQPAHLAEGLTDIVVPRLSGDLVLAEPIWTLAHMKHLSEWVHQTIRATGLTLEIHTFSHVSTPEALPEYVDMLLVEEVLESPRAYGYYEWMLSASGIRFALSVEERREHEAFVTGCMALAVDDAVGMLSEREQTWRKAGEFLVLFSGQEWISCSERVRGVELWPEGFCPFHRLWIGDGETQSG